MPYCPPPWIRRGAAAFMALAVAASVEAAIVDQSNVVTSTLQIAQSLPVSLDPTTGAKGSLMQSFTPTFTRLDWAAAGISASSGLQFMARILDPSDAEVLGVSTVSSAATNAFGGSCSDGFEGCELRMTEFFFATAIQLTPEATYWLEIMQLSDFTEGRGSWSATQAGFPTGALAAPGYAGGALLFNGSGSDVEDLIFATGLQRAADEPPTNGVPIAPTWALAALGLLAAGAARRHGRGMR